MIRLSTFALAAFAAAAAPAAAQEALTPGQAAAVDARIRAYILDNPEILVEAMEVLETRRLAAQDAADADLIAAHAGALFEDGYSHVFGAPEAEVTIVEFADYRCGYCKAAHPEVEALLASDPGVALVLKEFPILGPESVIAARAAMAALRLEPEAYPAFHDAMMAWRGPLDEATVFSFAEEAGLDPAALREAMRAPEIEAAIAETRDLAAALGINGTPGFVIGDRIVRGYVDRERLEALVAEARERRG